MQSLKFGPSANLSQKSVKGRRSTSFRKRIQINRLAEKISTANLQMSFVTFVKIKAAEKSVRLAIASLCSIP